jgi:hypothetical protein
MNLPVEALWTIIAFLLVGMLSVIGWFIRKDYARIEVGLQEEQAEREREMEKEREERGRDRHSLRDEIAAEAGLRHAFELRVAREYINTERLTEALAPFKGAIDQMRQDQRELFDRLHGKQDKMRTD